MEGNGTNRLVAGVVKSTNAHGIRLDSQEGWASWLNYSKFIHNGDIETPAVGAFVVATVDKAGFVRKLEVQHKEQPAPEPAPQESAAAVYVNADAKDIRITRLAVLNTATAILSSGGCACEAKDVVALAARLEAWVLR